MAKGSKGKNSAAKTEATSTMGAAHDAEEYHNAIVAVADILELAVKNVPANGMSTGVTAAVTFASQAIPALREAAEVISIAAPLAPLVGSAADQMPDVAKTVAGAASAAGSAVVEAAGNAAHAVTDPVNAALAERQAERARKEARRSIIEHASVHLSQDKFQENYDTHAKLFVGAEGDASYPGCYVIIRTGKGFLHDAADFDGVYVGAANDMWEAVAAQFAGDGNPDVYADAKYEAGVEVLMYPCPMAQTEGLHQALMVALDADVSYNARELA